MGLIALAVALLIEQLRPLRPDNRLYRLAREAVDLARRQSRTDRPFDAVIGWFAVVAGSIVLVLVLQWIAAAIGSLASFLLHVGILYLTIGFRQFGHNLAAILAALGRDDPGRASRLLDDWIAAGEGHAATARPEPAAGDELPGRVRLCRTAITHALMTAHRELFAPILAYLLLPGAIGPVVYRMVDLLARRWAEPGSAESDPAADDPVARTADSESAEDPRTHDPATESIDDPHAGIAARGMYIVDWIPLRVTAAGFAIAGDFEDSTYCWRAAIAAGAGHDRRAMLAAIGGGALGLDLVDPDRDRRWAGDRGNGASGPFDWVGAPPDAAGIRSAIALIWRAATLVVGLFVLVSLSSWLGN
ncbi:MAG: hypothetical protein OZ935_04375 [Pseudomonadota bacterium]|jgi:adenosylcobinamide-phosphate synthase|nr:hypothetical protein [Pseudomonadota bacterium]